MVRSTLQASIVCCLLGALPTTADAASDSPLDAATLTEDPGDWLSNYGDAMQLARQQQKYLVIFFHETGNNPARDAFERESLTDPKVRKLLDQHVLVRLSLNSEIVVSGERQKLLDHPAYAEMLGRQGVAVIDFANPDKKHYGHVVSTFPFSKGKYYRAEPLAIMLDLPAGTLTQRTMIYAVRLHPEHPQSTSGDFNPVLADEAAGHSRYQARIRNQGHHMWNTRFRRINSRLTGGGLAQEVVAESWPGESLVEAAVECVRSWRTSAGHWSAVRARQRVYGYDIKRGSNGIWYATGIFSSWRR